MGSAESDIQELESHQFPQQQYIKVEPQLWRSIKQPSLLLEEESVEISRKNKDIFWKGFELRNYSPFLVGAPYYDLRKEECSCSDRVFGKVYVEHCIGKLSEINNLPFPDAFHVYNQGLHGLKQLYEVFGCFGIEQEHISINIKFQAKIWIHERMTAFYPQESASSERQMLRQFLGIMKRKSLMDETYPHKVDLEDQLRGANSFDQAAKHYQKFLQAERVLIPAQLSILKQIGLDGYPSGSKFSQRNELPINLGILQRDHSSDIPGRKLHPNIEWVKTSHNSGYDQQAQLQQSQLYQQPQQNQQLRQSQQCHQQSQQYHQQSQQYHQQPPQSQQSQQLLKYTPQQSPKAQQHHHHHQQQHQHHHQQQQHKQHQQQQHRHLQQPHPQQQVYEQHNEPLYPFSKGCSSHNPVKMYRLNESSHNQKAANMWTQPPISISFLQPSELQPIPLQSPFKGMPIRFANSREFQGSQVIFPLIYDENHVHIKLQHLQDQTHTNIKIQQHGGEGQPKSKLQVNNSNNIIILDQSQAEAELARNRSETLLPNKRPTSVHNRSCQRRRSRSISQERNGLQVGDSFNKGKEINSKYNNTGAVSSSLDSATPKLASYKQPFDNFDIDPMILADMEKFNLSTN